MGKKHKNSVEEEINENDLDSQIVELDFNEDDVAYYIVDENDKEIGVCLIEDGQEVEYLYEPEKDEAELKQFAKEQAAVAAANIKVVRDQVSDFKDEAVEVAKELKAASSEIQSTMDEIKNSFKIFSKKKNK